jgi:hypothetical protein
MLVSLLFLKAFEVSIEVSGWPGTLATGEVEE